MPRDGPDQGGQRASTDSERGDQDDQEQQGERRDVEPPRLRGRERFSRKSAQLLNGLQSHFPSTLTPMMPLVRRREEEDFCTNSSTGQRSGTRSISSVRIRRPLLGFVLLSSLLGPAVSLAQITGDQVPLTRTVRTKEQIESQVENRRFRLGPVRLIPTLNLYNAGYDTNVFGLPAGREIADWTATIAAGVRWIIPAGPKFYVVGNATPTYVWYDRLENRRFLGGSYSAYLMGFFNRATLEIGGFNSKRLNYVSSEAQAPVIQTTLDGVVRMEVEVASNFAVFGRFNVARLRFGQERRAPWRGDREHRRVPADGGSRDGGRPLQHLLLP